MIQRLPLILLAGLILIGFTTSAEARKPARVFGGKVILSKTPFPGAFKSDRAFIRHMKKVNVRKVSYPKSGTLNLEFMAFFRKAKRATEFIAIVYDLSDRGRQAISFPIMPNQRTTQILASGFTMTKKDFPVEHKYRLVVSLGGRILAETKFAIKETKAEREERKQKEKALRRQKVDF